MPLSRINPDTEYRATPLELASSFQRWCFEQSTHHDRAGGFLSSMTHVIENARVVEFARRGGRIRLLCSPQLREADVSALSSGRAQMMDVVTERLIEEVHRLQSSRTSNFAARALATLVAVGAIEMRVALRAKSHGTLHDKLGVFEDQDGDSVSFIGSEPFAWQPHDGDGDYEAIEVFSSWSPDRIRVARHRSHFLRMWERRDPSLDVRDLPETVRAELIRYAAPSLGDLERPPEQHASTSLRPHQSAAIAAWKGHPHHHRGILKHATGSGKTITALFAMSPRLESGGVVLILVPSQLLLKQWRAAIARFHPDVNIMMVGAGHNDWRHRGALRSFTSPDPLLGGRIVLATMQTARTNDFLVRFRQGRHVLIVADEVHQLGSQENSRLLDLDTSWRLGLSATPERYGDAAGTERLMDYFGGIIQPEYTLADAIDDRNLVPYEYHTHVVILTDHEADEWRKQSKEIFAASNRENPAGERYLEPSDLLKRLLVRRSRIAKKASGKLHICGEVLQKYNAGQRWLVYCEDGEQLGAVLQEARRTWPQDVMEYHSGMADESRQATLRMFEDRGGILVAIACLDEGVDIPSISHALVLASSQNPRQFIQRRGRILRKHSGKRIAVIHDVLVSPESIDNEPTQMSLLKSELRRAMEFARFASNVSATATLRLIALRSGIDPNSVADSGTETETDATNTSGRVCSSE